MPIDEVTQTLRKALSRLQSERQHIDHQVAAIRTALGGAVEGRPVARRRPKMSAAARREVSQRMKAYWAARRAAKAGAKAVKGRRRARSEKAAAKTEK